MADNKEVPCNENNSVEKGEKSKGGKGKKKNKNRGQNTAVDSCCESNKCTDGQVSAANSNLGDAQQLERDQLVKLKKVSYQLVNVVIGWTFNFKEEYY